VIKASSVHPETGQSLVFLGLSDENWKRLRAGQPIVVNLRRDLSPDLPNLSVVILGGEDEQSLIDDLRSLGAKGLP
jgi:hypothetical protein